MFHSRRFKGNTFLSHFKKMACCCPNLFKRKKKHTFNPELDVQIEVNQAPKIIIKNDTEVEIEMGKRTSLENMNENIQKIIKKL